MAINGTSLDQTNMAYKIHTLNTIQQLGSIDFEIELTDDAGKFPQVRMWKNYPEGTTDVEIEADFDRTVKTVWAGAVQAEIDSLQITEDTPIVTE